MEGEGTSEEAYTQIQSNAESLDSSIVFHVIKDAIGFVLYMHQQIPSLLQDMSTEFDMLQTEYKDLETSLIQTEVKASLRRNCMSKMREVKHEIKRLEKLMSTISGLQTALQLTISEIPNLERVILVLGGSPVRPQHVYELLFSHEKSTPSSTCDFSRSKAAEVLSRKAIRTLISKDAGSTFYPGPTKLFLLVKAPSSFSMPLHFLPKRDFRYSKKIVPFRLQFKCKTHGIGMNAPDYSSQTVNSMGLTDAASSDLIWFQCRHVIKGLELQAPPEEQ